MKLSECLVFDIETTTIVKHYKELGEKGAELWEKRCHLRYPEFYNKLPEQFQYDKSEEFYQNIWEKKATYVPEYSKIVCISIGTLNGGTELLTKSYYKEEKEIIDSFFKICVKFFDTLETHKYLVGHNIKTFDISYLLKRAIINDFQYSDFPNIFQLRDKKPWELNTFLDTKEMFNFGSHMHYSTLDEVCFALGVKSPKDEIDGSKVYEEYYENDGLEKIKDYCEEDVKSTWEVFKKLI